VIDAVLLLNNRYQKHAVAAHQYAVQQFASLLSMCVGMQDSTGTSDAAASHTSQLAITNASALTAMTNERNAAVTVDFLVRICDHVNKVIRRRRLNSQVNEMLL
jgi:hypothetical protein